jgi:hypothetical protein
MSEPKRRMVIFMEGGLIQEIFTDFEMDVFVLDHDIMDSDDEDRIVNITNEHGRVERKYLNEWAIPADPITTERFIKQIKREN